MYVTIIEFSPFTTATNEDEKLWQCWVYLFTNTGDKREKNNRI